MKRKNYIKSPQHWKEMYSNPSFNGTWQSIDKVPIKSIKLDKSLLDYANDVDLSEVVYMVDNFYRSAWVPILVNRNYYLLDGQHRLAAAKKLGLKFIDVIVQTDDLRKSH